MKIFLHEIKEQQDQKLSFTQGEKWVADAVARVDETQEQTPEIARMSAAPKARPIDANFTLRKVDDVVVISGKIHTSVQLICSRCAKDYDYKVAPRFSALFCKDPAMAGVAHLEENGREMKPSGQMRGFARHAHDDSAENGEGEDLDISYISEDYIDLADLVTEQLRLQVPFQPLCREDCKGMCPRCGTDLNAGRCACAKLATTKPFSVLKNLKI